MLNNKSLNFIRLKRENFSNENFQIWWLISGMEVIKKAKFQFRIPKTTLARLCHKTQGRPGV